MKVRLLLHGRNKLLFESFIGGLLEGETTSCGGILPWCIMGLNILARG